jgi:hypothetical protein
MSISVSDDASRVILENRDVRDRELLLTGFLPAGGVALASHDSSRAFVYREDGGPRIVVYDLTGALESGAIYPELASIELPAAPTGDVGRLAAVTLAATPDDRVLVVSGDSSLVVLPLE